MGSFNVNGLGTKLGMVEDLMNGRRLDVLAVQESLLPAVHLTPVAIRGRSHVATAAMGKGERGLVVYVHNRLVVQTVWLHPCCVLVLVTDPTSCPRGVLVGNVHVPSHQPAVFITVLETVLRKQADFGCPAMLLGDFNLTPKEMRRALVGYKAVMRTSSQATNLSWRRRRTSGESVCIRTRIDHVVELPWATSSTTTTVTRVIADQTRTSSFGAYGPAGHRPIIADVTLRVLEPPTEGELHALVSKTKLVNRGGLTRIGPLTLGRHEAFKNLGAAPTVAALAAAMATALEDLGLLVDPKNPKQKVALISRKQRRAIQQLRKVMATRSGTVADPELARQLAEARKRVRECARCDRDKQWQATVARAWHKYGRQDWKAHNQTFKDCQLEAARKMGGEGGPVGATPVRRKDGTLATGPHDVMEVWTNHFKTIISPRVEDVPPPEHWTEKLAEQRVFGQFGPAPARLELNEDITWKEMWQVMLLLQKGKATGEDRVPAEVWLVGVVAAEHDEYKELCMQRNLSMDGEEADGQFPVRPPRPGETQVPRTELAAGLLKAVQTVMETGVIPDEWTLSLLVPVPKKGADSTNPDHYRGIALMSVTEKIFLKILERRLQQSLAASGSLSRFQGGFKSRQEAVALATGLVEVVSRRRACGAATVVAFVDYNKAYDRVSHEALFAKMEVMGISGRFLALIKGLYANSSVAVLLPGGYVGEAFPQRLGLRQGCPLSPVLFNIYINDIFDEMMILGLGVSVPGMPEEDLVPGLLFADDTALFMPANQARAARTMECLESWSDRWGAVVGHKKCGLMTFGPVGTPQMVVDTTVQGEAFESVREYTYLGILIDLQLDLNKALAARAEKGRRAAMGNRGFFKSTGFSMELKAKFLRSFVTSTMLYGGELFGMRLTEMKLATRAMETVVRMCVWWIWPEVAYLAKWEVVHAELNLPPVGDVMVGLRARAWVKCHNPLLTKTVLHDLVVNPPRAGEAGFVIPRGGWVSSVWGMWTNRWLRQRSDLDVPILVPTTMTLDDDGSTFGRTVRDTCWWSRQHMQVSGYHKWDFKHTRLLAWLAGVRDFGGRGTSGDGFSASTIQAYFGCRVGAFCRTNKVLHRQPEAERGPLTDRWHDRCCVCDEEVHTEHGLEELAHLMFGCAPIQTWLGRQEGWTLVRKQLRDWAALWCPHDWPSYENTVRELALLLGGAVPTAARPGHHASTIRTPVWWLAGGTRSARQTVDCPKLRAGQKRPYLSVAGALAQVMAERRSAMTTAGFRAPSM